MLKRLAAIAAVGLAGVILTLATPAHATTDDPAFQHGQPDFTAQPTGECGEIELTFTNPTPWLFVFDYRVDGQDPLHDSVAPGVEIDEGPLAGQEFGPRWNLVELNGQGTQTVVVPFTTSVEVRLAEGAEQKLYFDWRQVDTSTVKPCPTEPTEPSEPSDGQGGSDDGDDAAEKPGLPKTSGLTSLPLLLAAGGLLVTAGIGGIVIGRRRRPTLG